MTYDGINRLTGIQRRRGGAIFAGETSSYTYDSMGNLLSKSNFTASGTDNITFNVPTDGNVLTGETYDANGNRTTETASGISSITYNTLNLPESVTVDTLTVHYLYSAAGTKLKESSTDYSGNLIYKNGTLHKILTGGGYIETSDSLVALLSSPVYRFFLTDHLGSVRVVADAQGRVLQQNNQLPYGEDYAPVYAAGHSMTSGGGNIPPGEEIGEEPLGGVGTVGLNVLGDPIEDDGEELGNIPTLEPSTLYRSFNPYRFCGKEQMTSSGFYGFGARWYSPKTGRWTTQDPLSEKYYSISPYAYCAGNPVNIVDPDGADWYTNNETGYYTWFEGNEEIEGYTYYGGKGSLLGEAETMINELFEEMNKNEDSDNQKGLYINGFTLAIRDNKTQGCTGGKSILGLFGEFIFNKGPEYSVFLEDHPYTEDLKNNMHIRNSQDKIIASKSGYYMTSREWGPKDVPNTDIFSEQFMGSFTYYGKRNKENTVLHNVVFDSKSLYSLLYHLPFIKNKERSQTNHFGNTYQFYIWDTKL
ncbi:MAG: RHS repeat-associated core domain-containing protein [Bacteroidales bacterium]|nr:RHS repeat-associated core domain-containing protein [Bacteroidales bacterium]